MRCFIAIELPGRVAEAVASLIEELRNHDVRASWVRREHLHLTVRFLGTCEEDRVAAIRAGLRDSMNGLSPFPLAIQRVGAFPNVLRPEIIWIGAGPPGDALGRVQRACETAARQAGLPAETARFHPHITLARLKSRHVPAEFIEALLREGSFRAGEFTVPGVSLFDSTLTPRGPVYTRLEEFAFP